MTSTPPSPRPGGTAPHVIVSDVEHPRLDTDAHHHLERVRRIRPGEPVSVTDGDGRWRWCRFGTEFEPDGDVMTDARPEPSLQVGVALVKGDRPELVVQKLTEIGVDRIILFEAERSVVHWDAAKVERNLERLRRVAREALMQSRRTFLPRVEHRPAGVSGVVGGDPGSWCRAERGGSAIVPSSTSILIGPEGGWSPEERSTVPDEVSLGPNVLRAETAALVAGVLLTAARSNLLATERHSID